MANNTNTLNFREFVNQLRKDGDVADIYDAIDPNLELAAITRKAIEQRDKAPLFHKLIGAQNGFRAFGAPASCRQDRAKRYGRLARHLGLPDTATEEEIQLKLYSPVDLAPIPPKVVQTGICQENVILGNDVDLSKVPQLQIHTEDGGKYFQTYGVHCIDAPPQEPKWTNWSIARGMGLPAYGKNKMVCSVYQGQHIWQMTQLWAKHGYTEVPWALAFGAPPLAAVIGGSPIPEGASECDYVGALAGTAVEVVKCKTNNCTVPANSEIVFEGRISINKFVDEGPYGEMYGLLWRGEKKQWNVFTVDAITYRNDAIWPVSPTGTQADETHTIMGFSTAANALIKLRDAKLPVLHVHVPMESYVSWLVIQFDTKELAKLNTDSNALRQKVGDLLYPSGDVIIITNTILVDERINPYEFKEVIWALSTRSRPNMQQTFFNEVVNYPLMPFMSHGPVMGATKGGKVVTDCIFPFQYETPLQHDYAIADFNHNYSEAIRTRVNDKWLDWGFTTDPRGV